MTLTLPQRRLAPVISQWVSNHQVESTDAFVLRAQLENMSEHKVQAIYESLDSGNYKQALKQCEKMLKGGKSSPLITVRDQFPDTHATAGLVTGSSATDEGRAL